MKKVKVKNRYDIHYQEAGSGQAVLLIHGLAGDHTAWSEPAAQWSKRWHVITPDSRGAGRSTQVDEPISIADMASDMLEMLDGMDLPAVHVVGRSMGGCIAQEMALQAPQRVLSMALLASCGKLDATARRALDNMREVLEWRGSWADHARHSVLNFVSSDFFQRYPEKVRRIESIIGGESRIMACYSRQNLAVQAFDSLDRLDRIHCPVLIAHGGRDPLGGPELTGWMTQRLPQARVECFETSSHFFFMEHPERFMAMMDDWLTSQTGA